MHPSPITLVFCCNSYVIFTFKRNKVLANSLKLANYKEYYLCFKDVWLTQIYKVIPILTPSFSWIPSCSIFFSSFAWWYLHLCSVVFVSISQVGLIFYSRASTIVLCRKSSFWFLSSWFWVWCISSSSSQSSL